MLKLKNLTAAAIRKFAGSTVFNRGYGYFENGLVDEVNYHPEQESLRAKVSGNHGNYKVEITSPKSGIAATCTCPYEGYPCKHIVAVLLTFAHHREQFVRKAAEQKQEVASLETKIAALPKEELVQMILSCAGKYSEFKRELMVRFETNKEIALQAIFKDIKNAFPDPQYDEYSTGQIAEQLSIILKSVAEAPDHLRAEAYWAAADRILLELNEYGMYDESLEGMAVDALDLITECLAQNDSLAARKQEIIKKLMDYYTWGNNGMTDYIYETVHKLCSDKSDYQIIIATLKSKSKESSFHKDLLVDLYEKIGDEEAQRKTLESKLVYGLDYWELAQYWLKKGKHDKALEIVQQGLEKGEGRKSELYDYLQKYYEEQKNYGQIFALLERKAAKGELNYHNSLRTDPIYECLKRHYQAQKDYQGQINLLELRLSSQQIDLDLYKEAEKILRKDDWPAFEQQLLRRLEKTKPDNIFAWGGSSQALAEIFHYKKDWPKLFAVAQSHHDLLVKYEKLLLPIHAEFYLKHYLSQIDRLIHLRGRESYKTAAGYTRTVKRIYVTFLQQPKEWERYITNLRATHKPLRALQEELRNL